MVKIAKIKPNMSPTNQSKTRVIIFCLDYLPKTGGAEIAIHEICHRLNSNYYFDLICRGPNPSNNKEEDQNNVKVYRVGTKCSILNKFIYPWLAVRKAQKLNQKNKYQFAWAMLATWGGWAALKFKEKTKTPYILSMQSGDSDFFIKLRTWFWHSRYQQIYKKANTVQVISNWLKTRALKYGASQPIYLVPNGVDSKKFNKESINQNKINQLREEYNLDAQKIIFTDSRLVKKNNVRTLIKAFKKFKNISNYKSKLLIMGTGPQKNKLTQLTKLLKIENDVIFLGKQNYQIIQNFYFLADIFVRPSLTEGFGNVFVQAMAAEIPVIATPVGGIPDFIKEDKSGWLANPHKPQEIAQKMAYILDDKNQKKVETVVKNAKQMVEKKYSWDSVAHQMQQIFQQI